MGTKRNTVMNIFKILRLCMGLSLNQMAELCNVSAVYYGQLERGVKCNPSRTFVSDVARACGIKPETLEFFITKQQGEALDYQNSLLESLERLAVKMQQDELEKGSGHSDSAK